MKLPKPDEWFRELIPEPGKPSPWLEIDIPPPYVDAALEERRSCAELSNDDPRLPPRQRVWRRLNQVFAERLGRAFATADWTAMDGYTVVGVIHQCFAIFEKEDQIEKVIRGKYGTSPPDAPEYVFTVALHDGGGTELVLNAWGLVLAFCPAWREFLRRAEERGSDGQLTERAKVITAMIGLFTVTIEDALLPQDPALFPAKLGDALKMSDRRLREVMKIVAETLFSEGMRLGPPPASEKDDTGKGYDSLHSDPENALGTLLSYLYKRGRFPGETMNALALALDGRLRMADLIKQARRAARREDQVNVPPPSVGNKRVPFDEGAVSAPTLPPDQLALVGEILSTLASSQDITQEEAEMFLMWREGKSGERDRLTPIAEKFGMTKENVYYHVKKVRALLRKALD